MTRTARFHGFGGPEVLRLEDIPCSQPQSGEVQIRTQALGLNRAEALFRRGAYLEMPSFPSGIGLEAAGIVTAIDAEVHDIKVGNAVSLIPPVSMRLWPVHAEVINFPAKWVVKNPLNLSMNEAAATWMQYLTAYGALVDIAKLCSDDFVVITAASSSVGLAAIQIANIIGATPIAITRTDEKRQALLDAGAKHIVVSTEGHIAQSLREITGTAGARVIFDSIGGPIFTPLTEAMAMGGIFIEYGGLSQEPTPFPLLAALAKRLIFRGYLVHEIIEDTARLNAAKQWLLAQLNLGALRPVIARTFPFEKIADAHRYLESNEQFGKIVLTV